jgi:hypothetical protein
VAVVLTTGALCAGLAVTALPAYADVTSNDYTIGSATGAVSTVVATPTSVSASGSTNFEVSFTAASGLAGSSDSYITVASSVPLVSTPANIDLVGGSCIQGGTAGAGGAGSDLTSGITIELGSGCSISAGNTVEVFFTADAPSSTGTFYFTVSTSSNGTLATSNNINVGTSAGNLTASGYGFGSNAQYMITGATVSGLTTNENSILLDANVTLGTGDITWYSGTGGAGYSVSLTPPGGSATADPVTAATVVGNGVTLTLANALAEGDTLNITATGTNPPATSGNDAIDMVVVPGNGTAVTTSSITFGNSVSAVTVSPASTLAGATTTYNVNFRASTAVPVSGDIFFSETAGPTNFTAVTGVEVADTTQNTHFVASGVVLTDGSATIPVANPINAGDNVTLTLANVVNPAAATISDFKVSTSEDVLPTTAAPYSIGASASPGVSVGVSPNGLSALATYTISNVRATGPLAGGSSTITIVGPTGTVFPNTASLYSVQDSTTPAGSAAASAVVSGGGTNDVVIRVANSINSGDLLGLSVQDVINPSIASSTYTLMLQGSVAGLAPTPTTTTVPPTTTTTVPKPKPVASSGTTSAKVSKGVVKLKLVCKIVACTGVITLTDVRTEVGHSKFKVAAGKTGTISVGLLTDGKTLLAGAKKHTIKVTETITVTGGKTVKPKLTLVG